MLEQLLTVKEVMDHMHIKDRQTFNKILYIGDFPYIKIGREYLIPSNKYQQWIDNHVGDELW